MTRIRHMLAGAAIATALALPCTAAFADGHSEIVNAEQHAGYAAAAADVGTAHAHLHHTLNCLVGAGGQGFDAKEINPCAQAGNGAIPDAADAAKKSALEAAAAKAREGIAAADLAGAKKAATDAQAMLKAQE
ncbi:MAG TPA: hypothetical protein VG889_17875 [Rhizomicrobium sp.]|nr:hypothetical protein [Rhizomicrobium sp.]